MKVGAFHILVHHLQGTVSAHHDLRWFGTQIICSKLTRFRDAEAAAIVTRIGAVGAFKVTLQYSIHCIAEIQLSRGWFAPGQIQVEVLRLNLLVLIQ